MHLLDRFRQRLRDHELKFWPIHDNTVDPPAEGHQHARLIVSMPTETWHQRHLFAHGVETTTRDGGGGPTNLSDMVVSVQINPPNSVLHTMTQSPNCWLCLFYVTRPALILTQERIAVYTKNSRNVSKIHIPDPGGRKSTSRNPLTISSMSLRQTPRYSIEPHLFHQSSKHRALMHQSSRRAWGRSSRFPPARRPSGRCWPGAVLGTAATAPAVCSRTRGGTACPRSTGVSNL